MTKDEIVVKAAKGGDLPESGLDPADIFLFLAIRALYAKARHEGMSKEQGSKEKFAILSRYDEMKLWIRVIEEHRRKEREFEGAWEAFAKNPTLENADALHRAWYKCGLKVASSNLNKSE